MIDVCDEIAGMGPVDQRPGHVIVGDRPCETELRALDRGPYQIVRAGDRKLAGGEEDHAAIERSHDRAVHDDIDDASRRCQLENNPGEWPWRRGKGPDARGIGETRLREKLPGGEPLRDQA